MASIKLLDYLSSLIKDIKDNKFFSPTTVARIPTMAVFGYPGEKGWSDYLSPPTDPDGKPKVVKPPMSKLRYLMVWNWPYFGVLSVRNYLMKAVDAKVRRDTGMVKFMRPVPNLWWAWVAKIFVAIITVPIEVPTYLLSKIIDIPGEWISKKLSSTTSVSSPGKLESRKSEKPAKPLNSSAQGLKKRRDAVGQKAASDVEKTPLLAGVAASEEESKAQELVAAVPLISVAAKSAVKEPLTESAPNFLTELWEWLKNMFSWFTESKSTEKMVMPTSENTHASTWNIEEKLSSPTHDAHRHTSHASVAACHPVFSKSTDAPASVVKDVALGVVSTPKADAGDKVDDATDETPHRELKR